MKRAFYILLYGWFVGFAMPWALSAAVPVETPTNWRAPEVADVQTRALAALNAMEIPSEVREKVETLWTELPAAPTEEELLGCVARSAALCSPNAGKLVLQCSQPRDLKTNVSHAWLSDGGVPKFFADNLRLYYARWLVHASMFDEAQEQLARLKPGDVVAPASLLFYQSVVDHALLNQETGMKSIKELLQGGDAIPRRYAVLAGLMQEDMKDLKNDSLDHIARRMEDIRRRLDLGRAGPKVQKVEDGVIESLDKLIKQLEDQQQQQSSSEGSGIQPNRPASDSRPMGGKGTGQVTKREIGSGSGWGDLPPKQREEAMQQVGRDYPSHYRDAIEQYFRRLATEKNP